MADREREKEYNAVDANEVAFKALEKNGDLEGHTVFGIINGQLFYKGDSPDEAQIASEIYKCRKRLDPTTAVFIKERPLLLPSFGQDG